MAITNLAGTQVIALNDADGTTKITLTFTAPGDAAVTEVYRAPYGTTTTNAYPEYNDMPSAGVPATPGSYPPGAPWVLTGVTATGQTDEVAARGFWYFVAYTKDACGNVSAISNKTGGTLNYHLGDVSNGVTPGTGNNGVNTADISLLGAHYGVSLIYSDPFNYLDVGPTSDYSVNALPTTDNRVQFEDLMMFAINYGTVTKARETLVPAQTDELIVLVPSGTESGSTLLAHLWVRGSGRVQGLSARLVWNAAVVEPVGVEAGTLLRNLGGVALTPEPGTVDVALLGIGSGGLAGEGDLAVVRFRFIAVGELGIGITKVDARDSDNRHVEMGTHTGDTDPTASLPRVTALLANVPNPFNPTTKIPFTLALGGKVELAIFTVDGRKVRSLVNDTRQAGLYEVTWNGTDERGTRVSSGAYYVRLVTRDGTHSRPLVMLK